MPEARDVLLKFASKDDPYVRFLMDELSSAVVLLPDLDLVENYEIIVPKEEKNEEWDEEKI